MNELVKIENNEIIVKKGTIEQLKNFYELKAKMDIMEKELKQGLKEVMEEKGVKKFIVNGLCASIKDSTIRTTIDSKRLKEECPDIYKEYSKTTNVASSITLTFSE